MEILAFGYSKHTTHVDHTFLVAFAFSGPVSDLRLRDLGAGGSDSSSSDSALRF